MPHGSPVRSPPRKIRRHENFSWWKLAIMFRRWCGQLRKISNSNGVLLADSQSGSDPTSASHEWVRKRLPSACPMEWTSWCECVSGYMQIWKSASTFRKTAHDFCSNASPRLMHRQPRPQQTNPAMALIVFATFLLGPPVVPAQIPALPTSDFAWVDLTTIAPAIRIELRYATSENIAHRPLYPSGMQPLIRAGVARRLITAQAILRRYNCGLKIWDAYRTRDAQAQLWRLAPRND